MKNPARPAHPPRRVGLPLGLRNRLAELILDAFDDPGARETLEAVVAFCASGRMGEEAAARLRTLPWFEQRPGAPLRVRGAYRVHEEAVCQRAGAALGALGRERPRRESALAECLARAALLADAGLYFEVHELLEPTWLRMDGVERTGFQALIQIAVAFHHESNGNRVGAISLLTEGLAKLEAAGGALPIEIGTWRAALEATLSALREDRPGPELPAWPQPPRPHAAERPSW